MRRSRFIFLTKKKDRTYNTFSSKKILHQNELLFKMDSVLSKTKKVDANSELKDLIENRC